MNRTPDFTRPPGRMSAVSAACCWTLSPGECRELAAHFPRGSAAPTLPFKSSSRRVRIRRVEPRPGADASPATARTFLVRFRVKPDVRGSQVRLTPSEWSVWQGSVRTTAERRGKVAP